MAVTDRQTDRQRDVAVRT